MLYASIIGKSLSATQRGQPVMDFIGVGSVMYPAGSNHRVHRKEFGQLFRVYGKVDASLKSSHFSQTCIVWMESDDKW